MMVTADRKEADALVKRAYNLKTANESKALYRDWADTYEEAMVDGEIEGGPTVVVCLS